jgi:hypothetical protein
MKNLTLVKLPLLFALLTGAFSAGTSALADEHKHGVAAQTSTSVSEAAWLAKAKAEYPLDTCVVSGEKLEGDGMGGPVDYVFTEEGKPDRLVRFCCDDCKRTFSKSPAKFLRKIDEAAAKSGNSSSHR